MKADGQVVGYWREHSTLTHVVIRNAGHMVCFASSALAAG